MRILKFIGAFVGTFLVVFLIVFGFNLQSLEILFRNSESLQEGSQWVEKTTSLKGLTEYVGANAGHVSILSRSIEKPDSVLSYQPQTRRSMGRLANLFLLIEYARQVEKGEIDPEEVIPIDSVRRYQLPYIDQSGHEDAIDYLQNNGFVTDGLVPLDKLVDVTTRYNDLASADYLYFKLGSENIRALVQKLGLQHTDPPLPFSGLYQRVNPILTGTTFDSLQNDLRSLDRRIFEDQALVLSRKFAQQGVYRNRVLRIFEENRGLGIPFTKLRDALEFFPKTTADEFTALLGEACKGDLISKNISSKVLELLEWPLDSRRLETDFERYGGIFDSRMGLANGIDYGTSGYTGDRFVQAVFFDSLQVAFWFHMTSNYMHQDFQQRLIWDPALREAAIRQISRRPAESY